MMTNWPSAVALPNADLLLGLSSADRPTGFDATNVILIVLAAVAGYLVYEFIREHRARSGLALFGAVLGHLLFLLFLSLDVPGRFGCNVIEPKRELIEFEVAVIEEEKPPEPEPPPEPDEPEPEEPELEPEIQEPPPDPIKPKPKKQPEPDPTPPQPEPAPAKRWDLSQTTQGGNSGVLVQQGSGGEYGGTGKQDSKSKTKKQGGGDPEGDDEGTVAKWEPRSELFVKDPPVTLKVPEIECPATRELGVEGKVVLRVQVQRDGKVRKVSVVKGIGQGCDEIASKALKKARFKAAVGTNGQTVDFELTYDYVFTVKN